MTQFTEILEKLVVQFPGLIDTAKSTEQPVNGKNDIEVNTRFRNYGNIVLVKINAIDLNEVLRVWECSKLIKVRDYIKSLGSQPIYDSCKILDKTIFDPHYQKIAYHFPVGSCRVKLSSSDQSDQIKLYDLFDVMHIGFHPYTWDGKSM